MYVRVRGYVGCFLFRDHLSPAVTCSQFGWLGLYRALPGSTGLYRASTGMGSTGLSVTGLCRHELVCALLARFGLKHSCLFEPNPHLNFE